MAEQGAFADLAKGWEGYQDHLVAGVRPLTAEQLALAAAPHLRTIGQIAAHIVAARAGWLYNFLGEGPAEFETLHGWDGEDAPARSGEELAAGLELTWQPIEEGLARWTGQDYDEVLTIHRKGRTRVLTRGWIIWHLLEHDLHHGGELSLSLGMHGLPGIDI